MRNNLYHVYYVFDPLAPLDRQGRAFRPVAMVNEEYHANDAPPESPHYLWWAPDPQTAIAEVQRHRKEATQ